MTVKLRAYLGGRSHTVYVEISDGGLLAAVHAGGDYMDITPSLTASEKYRLLKRAQKQLQKETSKMPKLKPMTINAEPAEPPTCWGCGLDYLSRWAPEDLAEPANSDMPIQSVEAGDRVCPDCYEELIEAQG